MEAIFQEKCLEVAPLGSSKIFTEIKTKFNQALWGSKIEFFEKRKSVLKSAQKVDKIKYPQIFQKPKTDF